MTDVMNISGIECYEKDGAAYLKLEQEFSWLTTRLPTLWTNSYFVSTVGGATIPLFRRCSWKS